MNDATPRTFDHTAIGDLDEYHAVRAAIDDLIKAARRSGASLTLDDLLDMARTVYAADNCQCPPCRAEAERTDYQLDQRCWPFRAEVADGWMRGTYRCPRTGHTWTCGYTSDPTTFGDLP